MGVPTANLRLHAFWVFLSSKSAPPTNANHPTSNDWSRKPGPSVTRIAKTLPRMGFGYLGPSERGQGFFRVFEWKKRWPFDTWMKWKGGEKKRSPGIMTHVFGPTTMKTWVESSESSESAKMIFKSPTKKCSVFQNFQVCRRLHLLFLLQPDHQAARRTDIIWVFVSSSLRGPMPSETRWAKFEDRSRNLGNGYPQKWWALEFWPKIWLFSVSIFNF